VYGGEQPIYLFVYDDTWAWDGLSWQPLCTRPWCAGGQGDYAMTFDQERRTLVMYGAGWTWEWNGAMWDMVCGVSTSCANLPQRQDVGLAYDEQRGVTWLYGGYSSGVDLDELWSWDSGARSRPGNLMRVRFGTAEGPSPGDCLDRSRPCPIEEVSVTWTTGGTGDGDLTGTPLDGSSLLVWDGRAWRGVAHNGSSFASPGDLTWSTTDPALLGHIFTGDRQTATFAVVPRAPNGALADYAAVQSEWAEVTVRYRLP
jgi:hypothetical protein